MDAKKLHEAGARRAAMRDLENEADEDLRSERAAALSLELAREWLLEDAVEVSEKIEALPAERVTVLIELARRYALAGHSTECLRILAEAKRACDAIRPRWSRAESLLAVSRAQRQIGQEAEAAACLTEAIAEASKGQGSAENQDELDAASVLWEAAEEVALRGNVEAALETASTIASPVKRRRALERIGAIAALAVEK